MAVAVRIRDVWVPHGCSSSHSVCFGLYTAVVLHIRDVSGSTRLQLFTYGIFRVVHGCSSSYSGSFGVYTAAALHIRDISGCTRL